MLCPGNSVFVFCMRGCFFVLVPKPGKRTKECKELGVGILKRPYRIKGWGTLGGVGELGGVK